MNPAGPAQETTSGDRLKYWMDLQRPATTVALLAALLLPACGRERRTSPDAVARVGAAEVRYPQFEEYVKTSVGEIGPSLGSDVLSSLLDQFLDERLLLELARERGLGNTGQESRSGPGPRAAIDALLAAEPAAPPAAAEVAAYYDAHREEFTRPERVRLRQILVEERAAAEQARAELLAGGDFAEVAARYSRDRGAVAGLAGSELAREDLPAAMADAVFPLRAGETSPVLQADYGYHVFQVVARLPPQVVPLAEAAAEIRDTLARQAADARLRALVEEARSRYDVEVHARNLPFNYRGSYPLAGWPPR